MRRPPKYTRGFIDRHGKARWYFRREGYVGAALPGLPWSPEFMAAYSEAMNGETNPRPEIGASRTNPGTFDALIVRFYNSTIFASWAPETQRTRRNILERFRTETVPGANLNNGCCRVEHLKTKRVDAMIAAKMATPFAAKNFRKTLRSLMRFAVSEGMRNDDPTVGTTAPRAPRTSGFTSWNEEHILAFESRHAIGTRARLAFALLLYTGQRRGDVVRMGRQHVRGDLIDVRQNKTGEILQIPMHPHLCAIIDATPRDNMTFLMTEFGKPFSPAGFTNLMREYCSQAGLPKGYSAHGLRKAVGRRLAEAGCSAMQIAAILGHRSLVEAEKYVRAASQLKLARSAMARTYGEAGTGTEIGKPNDGFATREKLS